MTPEESKELRELVEFLKENNIGEFEFERAEVKVRIKFGSQTQAAVPSVTDLANLRMLLASQPASSGEAAPSRSEKSAAPAESEAQEEADLHVVKSPIVGTFYESPSPGASPFVKIGDQVENGQVLCIVEAMKLMNEIESDAAGEVVKRFVSSGQPVEYGQPLFALRSR
ncbi:MAG TPA: acetyl-CoA carboxylase biotin carboxyl carrier protein [Acidobacteriaceae bacterium]|nr:acetyl-CoA carboxylase biotin carboxyl carrier protein [Acidobacteriaceae bacterium]